jgi:4-amino-4-deoxy-L-arabinose transferase-like glycosyltransferase
VNFASAIYEFDIANESPHPPGYIIYVWLTRTVNLIFHDPQMTMVSISMFSSALAVVGLYYLGRLMFNQRIGLIASLFLATSPIFWFYGEIALPHTLDMVFVILSVLMLYKIIHRDYRFLYPAIVTIAIAGGLRPQTLVFLLPLVMFSLRKAGVRRIVIAGLTGAATCLIWFLPLINASGGLLEYLNIMKIFGDRFQETTSIFMGAGLVGLQRNTAKVVLYTLYGLSLTIFPMLAYCLGVLTKYFRTNIDEKKLFIAFWILPALVFYLIIHMGQQGLIFVYLPALFLLAAFAIDRIFIERRFLLVSGIICILFFNISVFLFLPEYPFGSETQRMLTHDTLKNSDLYFQVRFEAIEYNFEANRTGIVAWNWRHPGFYLPEYPRIPLDFAKWGKIGALKDQRYLTVHDLGYELGEAESMYLVLFDEGLELTDQSKEGKLKRIQMRNGETLAYYELSARDRLYIDLDPVRLTLQEEKTN